MKKETELQTDVVKYIKSTGGFAMKLHHRMFVGVPDLFIQLPGLSIFVEVKLMPWPVRSNNVHVLVTPLQCQTLNAIRAAGGNCAVLVFSYCNPKSGVWSVYKDEFVKEFDIHKTSFLFDPNFVTLERALRS